MSQTINIQVLNNNTLLKLELDNESKNNALSISMLDQLIDVLTDKKIIKNLKCIIITGAKKGPFCSGADLTDIEKLKKANNMNFYHKKLNYLLNIIKNI